MRVLHVSTYDDHGGAARAAYRLFTGLKGECDVRFVAKEKRCGDPAVSQLPVRQQSLFRKKTYQLTGLLRKHPGALQVPSGFSPPAEDFHGADLAGAVAAYQPDIVHLHWLCNQFLALEELTRIHRPLVWTLHDSWPFTGGCHVPGDCTAYRQQCGNCPVLASGRGEDLSRALLRRKQQAYAGLNLTVVSPSRWLADCARQSPLLGARRIEVIPHGLDLAVFRPVARTVARRALGLAEDETLVLFGGMSSTRDPNKGYDLLVEALSTLTDQCWLDRTRLLVFGAGEEERPAVNLPVAQQHLGYLNDDVSLVLVYSAADVMVVPSRREAFGQTAMEALACGTPVVCFRTTGLIDIVDHHATGYLAAPYDAEDLARGIVWATTADQRGELRDRARRKAEQAFAQAIVAGRHMELYRGLSPTAAQDHR